MSPAQVVPAARVAVVTGAGSGVGQATAIALARAGWRVALVGRTLSSLQATRDAAGAAGAVTAHVADLGVAAQVAAMASEVLAAHGTVHALVNAAGTNTPQRSLEALSDDDYHRVVDANLHGSYYCARAFLPAMRRQQSGTIVNVVSIAGLRASALSGVAYVVSKFGQAGLTQSINAEENARGIRACSVFPGDIDTPLLDKRPAPPPAEARTRMLGAQDVADCVLLALALPERAVVEEIVVRPR